MTQTGFHVVVADVAPLVPWYYPNNVNDVNNDDTFFCEYDSAVEFHQVRTENVDEEARLWYNVASGE